MGEPVRLRVPAWSIRIGDKILDRPGEPIVKAIGHGLNGRWHVSTDSGMIGFPDRLVPVFVLREPSEV